MNDIPVSVILVLILLLLCAGLFSIIFKRLRFPYTIGLVLVGLGLGAASQHMEGLSFIGRIHFTPNIVLYILLPTLVFDAALNLDTRLLIKNLLPVVLLAAPGLVLATLVTGALLGWLTPLSYGAAMLFGALISATDPVAVIAVFKELGAPKRLTMLVDGESLFNDATAIVMFGIVLGLLTGGGALGGAAVAGAAVQFIAVFLGGALVGALVGYAMVQVLSMARGDPLVEIAFTAVIAYVAFILAQFYLDLSGVMAVVGAGLVVSYYGSTRFSPDVKKQLGHFWEFACFAANSYIFLLLGLTEGYLSRSLERLAHTGLVVGVAIAAVLIARALLVYGGVPLINRLSRQPAVGRAYQTVMFWGGLRGALPIALAMSLTPGQVGGEVNRTLILDCTLGVVLFTLLIQGTTISRLMDGLKLNAFSPLEKLVLANAEQAARQRGLRTVEQIEQDWPALDKRPIEKIRASCERAIASCSREQEGVRDGELAAARVSEGELWLLALYETNAVWRRLFGQGFLREQVLREYEHYFGACREDILRGVMPPQVPRRPGIEQRGRDFVLRLLSRTGVGAGWTERMRQAGIRERYSIALAVTSAWGSVQRNLPHFSGLCRATEEQAGKCAAWFRAWNDEALDDIRQIMAEHEAEAVILQETTIRHLAREAEQQHIAEMVDRGGISGRLAAELEETLAREQA